MSREFSLLGQVIWKILSSCPPGSDELLSKLPPGLMIPYLFYSKYPDQLCLSSLIVHLMNTKYRLEFDFEESDTIDVYFLTEQGTMQHTVDTLAPGEATALEMDFLKLLSEEGYPISDIYDVFSMHNPDPPWYIPYQSRVFFEDDPDYWIWQMFVVLSGHAEEEDELPELPLLALFEPGLLDEASFFDKLALLGEPYSRFPLVYRVALSVSGNYLIDNAHSACWECEPQLEWSFANLEALKVEYQRMKEILAEVHAVCKQIEKIPEAWNVIAACWNAALVDGPVDPKMISSFRGEQCPCYREFRTA